MIKKPKFIKTIKILTLILCICIFVTSNVSFDTQVLHADTTDDLTKKLNDLNQQIQDIKKQKQDVENKLSQESSNQSSLTYQINAYNSKIQSLQLDIDEKTKNIQSLQTQIQITQNNVNTTKSKIIDLQNQIKDLSIKYETTVQSHFQNSFHTTFNSLFDNNFETFLVQRQFSTTIAREDTQVAEELNKNQADLKAQQDSLSAQLQQQQSLQDQTKLEANLLGTSQTNLNYQKGQKTVSLQSSLDNAAQLEQKKAELNKIAQDAQKQLDAYLLQIISVRGSGTVVHKGDVIGRMGRSGFVLTGIPGYYPDPITEPCGGAHTHLEVSKDIGNGVYQRTNPLPYLENGTVSPPYHTYTITQYYGENVSIYGGIGHPGIDYYGDQGCGTPIYSGVDGVIKYYCRPFQYPGHIADPTYIAVIYDPTHDINVTYLHLKKAPGSC